MIFARKMPEFYVIIARKIFFPNFRKARDPPPCPSRLLYTYDVCLLLYKFYFVLITVDNKNNYCSIILTTYRKTSTATRSCPDPKTAVIYFWSPGGVRLVRCDRVRRQRRRTRRRRTRHAAAALRPPPLLLRPLSVLLRPPLVLLHAAAAVV